MTPVTSEAPAWMAVLPSGTPAYIAVPSRLRPVLVTSRDPQILRYLADSVLSVPPGAKALRSIALTVGLRLLRYRTPWIVAALCGRQGVMLGRRIG